MSRRVPLFSTIVVLAAVAIMAWLGTWQLQRAKWKEQLLERSAAAEKLPPISWPTERLAEGPLPLFRHATGVCLRPLGQRAAAGENARGETGYVMIVDCTTGRGATMAVQVGWTRNPNAKVNWSGGPVSGIIVPDAKAGMRLVAASSPPGLEPSKVPDPRATAAITPGTHIGYAWTWFSLAAAALLIYVLALWKRADREVPQR